MFDVVTQVEAPAACGDDFVGGVLRFRIIALAPITTLSPIFEWPMIVARMKRNGIRERP